MIHASQPSTLPPTTEATVARSEYEVTVKKDLFSDEKMENCSDEVLLENGVEGKGEFEIDVVKCGDDDDELLVVHSDENDPCATEYSSSFGGTFSGSEDGLEQDSDNMEVESNGLSQLYAGNNKVLSKKKVTEHWRRFIHPLAWRCRWLELRMKELSNQVSKYKRELGVYEQEKQLQASLSCTDDVASRETSLICRSRVKTLKRRKRKRSEQTCDIPSYMEQHAVFSYYEKKPERDVHVASEGIGNQVENENFGVCFEWPTPEAGDNEKSLEQILLDIEFLQSRVIDLTSQLKTIDFNNTSGMISTSGTTSVPGEYPHNSPSLSSGPSPVNNGTTNSPSASAFENEEKVVHTGSVASSYDNGGRVNVVESTMDLLSSAITNGEHQNLGNDGLDDDILINNQVVSEEFHRIEKDDRGKAPQVTVDEGEEEQNFDHKVSSSETETDIEIAPIVQKARRSSEVDVNLRRSNRKRKIRRGSSPGIWIGEPKRKRKKSRKG